MANRSIQDAFERFWEHTLIAIDDKINNIETGENKADTIQERSGSVISTNNSAYTPVKGLKLFGKTTQDGTPSPENPVELVSVGDGGSVKTTVAGKNLLELTTAGLSAKGITFTVNNDGSVTANGTAESTVYFLIKTFTYGEGNYILSGCPEGGGNGTYSLYDSDAGKYDLGKGVEIEGEHTGKIYISVAGGLTVSNLTFYPMIRHASITDATFEPYKGQTLTASTPNGLPGIPVTSGGNYTDADGQQWICDEIDFARGVYVQRFGKKVFYGTETLTTLATGNRKAFYYTFKDEADPYTKDGAGCSLCTHFANGDIISSTTTIGHQVRQVSDTGAFRVLFRPNGVADMSTDDFKAFLAAQYAAGTPVKVKYALAEPIETPLSEEELAAYATLHTNNPNTTVYNDAGAHMELTYYTPSTAVPMVYSPADKDKVLSIDEHGCVVLKKQVATDTTLTQSGAAADAKAVGDKLIGLATETYVNNKVATIPTPDVSGQISTHNTATDAHNDIRDLITGLSTRLNTLADSDDTTLDQMSEIVNYIKSNKSLIESITTSKVNVSDIIDNLTTNVSNKPLSAAQGVVIKGLIDALQTAVDGKALNSDLTSHTGDTTKHITSTERTNWNNKVGSLTDLGINASATELNYTKGVTNDIQTQINTLSAEINNLKTNVITVHSGDVVPMSSLGSNGDIYMVTGS